VNDNRNAKKWDNLFSSIPFIGGVGDRVRFNFNRAVFTGGMGVEACLDIFKRSGTIFP